MLDCLSHEIATKLKSQLSYTFSALIFSRLRKLTPNRDFSLDEGGNDEQWLERVLFGYLVICTKRFFVVARIRAHEEMRLIRFLAIDTGRECNQKIPTSCSAQVQIETGVKMNSPFSLSSQILNPKCILSLALPL